MHVEVSTFLPFFAWLRNYGRRYLKADIVAGLTVAVVAVPQSMAYALIAGLPVQYGLYASIVPTIAGALWGSSAHLITGPTTAVSLVVFSTLLPMAEPNSGAYLALAFILAIMVGIIQIAMGAARLGALLNYVSHSVILGFTAGAAVLIGFKQIPGLLGLSVEKSHIFLEYLVRILAKLPEVHLPTFLLGGTTIAVILLTQRFRPKWPGTLIAMIVAALLVFLFNLDERGVKTVGAIPRSLPPFQFPWISESARVGELLFGAMAIAILGLMEAVSIAKAISGQTHQRLNINQEFIGQGLSNIAAGFFSGYPGSGSFTRSAVNFRSGAKTPMSAVISAVAVAATLLLIAPLAALLPLASLAGVLMVAAYTMVRKEDIKRTIRATRSDAAVLVITFASTLLLNIEFAIYVGVLLSIGLHLAKTSHPRIYSTVPDLETGKMVGTVRGKTCCQMDIIRIEGSIFFGSSAFVLEDLQRRLRQHPRTSNLLLRMHQVNVLDASGVHLLEIVLEQLRDRGGGIFFSGVNSRVFEVIKNSGLLREMGEPHVRTATGSAIRQAIRENFCPAICAACEESVFTECPELKNGNWEIFGEGVRPRICLLATS